VSQNENSAAGHVCSDKQCSVKNHHLLLVLDAVTSGHGWHDARRRISV
jgi:hypothetical protein